MTMIDSIRAMVDRFISEVYESFNKDESEIDNWIG